MAISNDLIQLHEDLIKFGSKVQSISVKIFDEKQHIESNVHAAFYKINAYAVTLHRAIFSLCEDGWTHITPLLLRTIMECSSNCLAIVHNELHEYMAFKYLYYEYLKAYQDKTSSIETKKKSLSDIKQGISHIKNLSAKKTAEEYIKQEQSYIFWFKPEENSVSSIISDYGSSELKDVYGFLSWSVHATHFGLFAFKDNPDDIDINPCENPNKTKLAIVFSCRLLLELLRIRYVYEGLRFSSEYDRFMERIFAFEKETVDKIKETVKV